MARPRKDQMIDIPARAIQETIRLLGERDAAALTMNAVADAVGCRAPALYNHFRNKNALLRAVHDAGFQRLYANKLAVAARTGGDALARLREGGLAYLRFARDNPALYRLMFDPPPLPELSANPFQEDVGRRSLDFLRASIEACQAEGYLPGRDPALVAFTLWSTVHGAADLLIQQRAPQPAMATEQLIIATVDTVMGMVAATRIAQSRTQ